MNPKSLDNAASITILEEPHRRTFERALMRLLETDLAEETYAEILDGMPTAATWTELYGGRTHPANNHHEHCPGARDRAREFRAGFDATSLQFPLLTILAFLEAQPGSKEFNLRLLELLVISCHQIAVYLYEINGTTPHFAEHITWRDEPREIHWYNKYRPPIVFCHGPYNAAEQYPHGIADVAGCWVETKIFGGVIVFDRGETEVEVCIYNIRTIELSIFTSLKTTNKPIVSGYLYSRPPAQLPKYSIPPDPGTIQFTDEVST